MCRIEVCSGWVQCLIATFKAQWLRTETRHAQCRWQVCWCLREVAWGDCPSLGRWGKKAEGLSVPLVQSSGLLSLSFFTPLSWEMLPRDWDRGDKILCQSHYQGPHDCVYLELTHWQGAQSLVAWVGQRGHYCELVPTLFSEQICQDHLG